jgi:hypothetical protein
MGTATKALLLATGMLAFCGTAGLAASLANSTHLESPLRYPGAPKPPSDEPASPYPMNYVDEAALALGVKEGHMDLFSSRPAPGNPFMPVFSGGLGSNGAMLKLQWRQGS